MTEMGDGSVFSVVGEDAFVRLVHGFYRRVADDDVLGPLYPKGDMAGAEERLRGFLIYRFGGPATYIETRGHPRLRMRHSPFPVDQRARDRWLQLMLASLDDTGIREDAAAVLREYFESTATAMMNR